MVEPTLEKITIKFLLTMEMLCKFIRLTQCHLLLYFTFSLLDVPTNNQVANSTLADTELLDLGAGLAWLQFISSRLGNLLLSPKNAVVTTKPSQQ